VNNIRAFVSALLAKVDSFLTTEPARLIGYGAAVVVFLVVQLLGIVKPGLLPALSFEDAIGDAFAAIATLVILVESIRRFVFSPQTYIENLSDEAQAAHEAAHLEEDMQKWLDAVRARNIQPKSDPEPEAVKGAVSIQTDKVQ
jgi:hypothetical protein